MSIHSSAEHGDTHSPPPPMFNVGKVGKRTSDKNAHLFIPSGQHPGAAPFNLESRGWEGGARASLTSDAHLFIPHRYLCCGVCGGVKDVGASRSMWGCMMYVRRALSARARETQLAWPIPSTLTLDLFFVMKTDEDG